MDKPLFEIRQSKTHGRGLYAADDIQKGQRILEYVGDKITKAESDKRASTPQAQIDLKNGCVYIFELSDTHDIDGDVEWNPARLINHSCEPNASTELDAGHIWICAARDIKAGEELAYDYGFGRDGWADHPCLCGTAHCFGFIVDRSHWNAIRTTKRYSRLMRIRRHFEKKH
jgi:uncharacterized protein